MMKRTFAAVAGSLMLIASCPAQAADFISLPGSFNSEIGCPGDWQPDCPAAQMTKAADGLWYAQFTLPVGDFEFKVAYNRDWDENYGWGGIAGGANLLFQVEESDSVVYFRHDEATKLTSVQFSAFNAGVPEPAAWAFMIAGFGLLGAVARRRTAASAAYA